jgi:hypothetical protein
VPIGVVWLTSSRRYAPAKAASVVAALVGAGAALLVVANGSLAAGAVVLATCVNRLVHLWRRVKAAQTNGVTLPHTAPVALIVIPLAAMAARMALVEPTATWSRDRAIANAAEIITDIEQFRERAGTIRSHSAPSGRIISLASSASTAIGMNRAGRRTTSTSSTLQRISARVRSLCTTPAASRTSQATPLTCFDSRRKKSAGSAGTLRRMTCRRLTGSGFSSIERIAFGDGDRFAVTLKVRAVTAGLRVGRWTR